MYIIDICKTMNIYVYMYIDMYVCMHPKREFLCKLMRIGLETRPGNVCVGIQLLA